MTVFDTSSLLRRFVILHTAVHPADLLKFIWRLAREVGYDAVRRFQIEHLEDRIIGGIVLPLHDRVLHTHLLCCHIVFENGSAMQPEPCIRGARHRYLDLRVCLHVLVDFLRVVGAEPQPAVELACEHERAALRLAVAAYRCQILYRIFVQEFCYFFHFDYLRLSVAAGIGPGGFPTARMKPVTGLSIHRMICKLSLRCNVVCYNHDHSRRLL